jgi:hypothetical protein
LSREVPFARYGGIASTPIPSVSVNEAITAPPLISEAGEIMCPDRVKTVCVALYGICRFFVCSQIRLKPLFFVVLISLLVYKRRDSFVFKFHSPLIPLSLERDVSDFFPEAKEALIYSIENSPTMLAQSVLL